MFSLSRVIKKTGIVSAVLSLPLVTFAQGGIAFKIASPLAFGSFEDFLVAVLNIIIIIATPIVVLCIIYAGFLYVTAQGNVQQTQQATRALTYSIIGGVLIIGAVAISGIIASTIGAFTP